MVDKDPPTSTRHPSLMTVSTVAFTLLGSLLLLGILFTGAAAASGHHSGNLNVTSDDVQAAAGETTTLNVTVTNEGDRIYSDVTVEAESLPSNWTATNATINWLESNETKTATLNLTTEGDAEPGLYELNISATAPGNVSSTTTSTVEIIPEQTTTPTPHPTVASPEPPSDGPTETESKNESGGGGFAPVVTSCEYDILGQCLDGPIPDFEFPDWWPF